MIRAKPPAKGHNSKAGPVNADRLKSFVERIERLEEEKKALQGDIKDIYAEVKSVGYDVKTTRKVVSLRQMDAAARAEQETLLDVYKHALGMAVASVASGELSLREAARKSGVSKSSIHRALAVPAVSHDPGTGEINPGEGAADAAKSVTAQTAAPPEASQTADLDTLPGDGEASAEERDASASPSPPESCGSVESRHASTLPESNLADDSRDPMLRRVGSEQSPSSTKALPQAEEAFSAQGTAGVATGPQDIDTTIPPFLRRERVSA